jgi:putative inorganic carbon (HCO3(-)) transporter
MKDSHWILIYAALAFLLVPLLLFPRGVWPFLALGVALLLVLWRWSSVGRPPPTSIDIPLFILVCMALVGLTVSVDRSLSWPRFWSLVLGVLIFYGIRFSIQRDSPSSATWITVVLAVAGLGLAGVSLIGTDWSELRFFNLPWLYDRLPALIRGLPGSGVPRNSDLFNPRWVGITMGVLAPVYLALLGWGGRLWLRALVALAFVVVTGMLLMTQSIQGLLGLAVGAFVCLLFVSRWFWLLLPVAILTVAGLVQRIGIIEAGTSLLSVNNPIGVAVVLRLDMWSQALAMLRDMPFTGIGLNTFPLIQSQFYTGYIIGPEPHAHNLYLQTALDFGVPGLAAFLWFVLAWIVLVLKGIKQTQLTGNRFLLIGALAGIVSYMAHGMIDALMLGAEPTIVVWGLFGIGAVLSESRAYQLTPRPLKTHLIWLVLPLSIGLLAFLRPATVFMNLGALQAQRLLYPFPHVLDTAPNNIAAPRANLQKALRLDPLKSQPYLLLGRIASLEGDYQEAEQYYRQRVALDMREPLARYDIPELILNWLAPPTQLAPAAELLKIYQNWNLRFPERAETYLLMSLVASQYQADPDRGGALLQAGVQAGAQPSGLLLDALDMK